MKKYFLLFVLAFSIYVFHTIYTGQGIYGDGNGYYTFAQSLYFEKSLNFRPIFDYLSNFNSNKGIFSRIFWDTRPGPIGILKNPFPIGTGIVWIPSLFFIDTLGRLFQLNLNKFSLLYEMGPGLTGIIMVVSGCYFLEKYLCNFFDKKIAQTTVLLFFFASNLFYYASFEPGLSHQPAFFLISFLLWKTHKMKRQTLNYLIVAALSGLLFIIRTPDTILLIPVWWQVLKTGPSGKNLVLMALTGTIFTLPLWISYYLMFGNPLAMPYLTGFSGTFIFKVVRIAEFFFSARMGLFIWTPVYLIGIFGLFLKRSYLAILTLALLFLTCSFWSGSNSAGFGERFVLSAIPYFAIGTAQIFSKISLKASYILFLVLFFWNFLTLFQFYFDTANLLKNPNLTLSQFFLGQFGAPLRAVLIIKEKGFAYFWNSIS